MAPFRLADRRLALLALATLLTHYHIHSMIWSTSDTRGDALDAQPRADRSFSHQVSPASSTQGAPVPAHESPPPPQPQNSAQDDTLRSSPPASLGLRSIADDVAHCETSASTCDVCKRSSPRSRLWTLASGACGAVPWEAARATSRATRNSHAPTLYAAVAGTLGRKCTAVSPKGFKAPALGKPAVRVSSPSLLTSPLCRLMKAVRPRL